MRLKISTDLKTISKKYCGVRVQKQSIISGTGADAIWSEMNFGPTGHHHLEVIPFHAYAPFPALLPFFKCMLEVVFCECEILPRPPQLCQNGGLSVVS
jgi:hypothetical protein